MLRSRRARDVISTYVVISGPLLDLALSLRIARLTNTDENMTLLKHVLVPGGVETTGKCLLSVVNINICKNSLQYLALRVGSINIDPSIDLSDPIGLLLVNLWIT